MTLTEFVAKYNGKYIDVDNAYGGQCVDLARQYIMEVLGFPNSSIQPVVGAKDMYNKYDTLVDSSLFDRVANTPLGVPKEGDIIIWGNGTYGHVAVFIEGNETSFKSFDQNLPTGSPCHIQIHNYVNVLGWLVPKTTNIQDELDRVRAERDTNHNKLTEIANLLGTPTELESMKAEINKFLTYEDVIRKNTEELKIKTDEIVNLQRRLEELTSQVELLFTGNTEAQKTIVEQGLEIENQKVQYKEQERFINLLSDRLTALKEDLQTALNKALAGHNGWELVKIGLKKIFIG